MLYYDPDSYATNPGGVSLSPRKFKEACKYVPLMNKLLLMGQAAKDSTFEAVDQWLRLGATNPAVVISLNPLIVSAYALDVDAVLFLKFPDELADIYSLTVGTRLATSNFFQQWEPKDIIQGEYSTHMYSSFTPIVQLFLSDDVEKIRENTEMIAEDEWGRLAILTKEKQTKYPKMKPRNGFFFIQ